MKSWKTTLSVAALAGLTLAGCSKTDEQLADAAKGATKVSDLFVNLCYRTQADIKRVRHIADLNKWKVLDGAPVGKDSTSWMTTVGGQPVLILAGRGPDDRPKVGPGKMLELCAVSANPAQEKNFAAEVEGQVDLKKIDPAHYVFTNRPPTLSTAMSESGAEDGSFEVLLGPNGGMAAKQN